MRVHETNLNLHFSCSFLCADAAAAAAQSIPPNLSAATASKLASSSVRVVVRMLELAKVITRNKKCLLLPGLLIPAGTST